MIHGDFIQEQYVQGERDGLLIYSENTLLAEFTKAAMQGICVNAGRNAHDFRKPENIAETAVKVARATLAELEKTYADEKQSKEN